jgi:hypothetical protein
MAVRGVKPADLSHSWESQEFWEFPANPAADEDVLAASAGPADLFRPDFGVLRLTHPEQHEKLEQRNPVGRTAEKAGISATNIPISVSFNLSRASARARATMAINHNDNTILGTNSTRQGCVNAVRGWHSAAYLAARALEACGLFVSRGFWYALGLKRQPAPAMTPISATCCSTSVRRHQRDQRWMSGVVVDPGTVGVS